MLGCPKICARLLGCQNIRCDDDADIRQRSFGHWPAWGRLWMIDWDGKHPTSEVAKLRDTGVTRHVILIRHGQYDFGTKRLTDLGRTQARITGDRLVHMIQTPIEDFYGKVSVKVAYVAHSDVARAQETAAIIKDVLTERLAQDAPTFTQDPLLAEGWPCVPEGWRSDIRPAKLLRDSVRIEAAFRKYISRSTDWKKTKSEAPSAVATPEVPAPSGDASANRHEYIVLVCHQNVIRYFVCRALQFPPEFWLRFKGDNCGITELLIHDDGKVSLSKFADVGHLPNNMHTFH